MLCSARERDAHFVRDAGRAVIEGCAHPSNLPMRKKNTAFGEKKNAV